MKRLLITLLLGMAVLCQAAAQNTSLKRHQVRIGWGDMLFETLAFHNSPSRLDGTVKTRDYRYTGHIFADYRYQLSKLIGLGVQTDFQGIFWKEGTAPSDNYDLSILPTIRFTYFRSEWVELYAGAAVGLMPAVWRRRPWSASTPSACSSERAPGPGRPKSPRSPPSPAPTKSICWAPASFPLA